MKLRCESGHTFAEVIGPEEVEFRCRSRQCGYEPGVLVLHRFDTRTGKLIETKLYRDAVLLRKE